MTVRRLFVRRLPDEGGRVTLEEGAARHVRVLRLRQGDDVVLFDGKGRAAEGVLDSLADPVSCSVSAPTMAATPSTRLSLMLAIPKGSKLDDCVRTATELGVDEVLLTQTERTVPRWDPQRAQTRLDRLARIACEAAAQSERSEVPIIHPPRTCEGWLGDVPPRTAGVVFAARASERLRIDGTPEQVWCAIGPEGGFTEAELSLFERAGFAAASLGTLVLRVETAVPAALSLVRDRLEEPGQAR